MDIRNWPLDKIMQLPDWCFGRRFVVSCAIFVSAPGTFWDISELGLPERCCIWEVMVSAGKRDQDDGKVRLALGDNLPAATAEVDRFDPLIPGLGVQGAGPRQIWLGPGLCLHLVNLRQAVQARGRRLVVELDAGVGQIVHLQVAVVVSSLPTEVPDWLVSAKE